MKKSRYKFVVWIGKNGNNTLRFPKLFMTLKNNPTIQHLSRNFWNIKVWENSYQFRPFLLHFFGVKKNLDGPVLETIIGKTGRPTGLPVPHTSFFKFLALNHHGHIYWLGPFFKIRYRTESITLNLCDTRRTMATSPHTTKIALILNVKIVVIVSWDTITCHISKAVLGGYHAIIEHTYTLQDA